MENWVYLTLNDIDTFPNEGIDVLVTDGKKYDVVWYLMSSEYKWMKTDLINDEANEFNSFTIKKWRYVTKSDIRKWKLNKINNLAP